MSGPRKTAIVTGAGSGIGKAVALAFLRDGCNVALAGRRRGPLEETAAEAPAGGAAGRALVVPTDVRDRTAVDALFAAAVEAFGRVDVLFNNAGIYTAPASIEDVTPEDWRAAVDTNLNGMFLCLQAAFRVMKSQKPQGGRIINNGSVSAHSPRPNAVTGLTRAASLEGRRHGIACGQIDIGNAGTELTRRMLANAAATSSSAPEALMDVDSVAATVLQMARLPLEANILQLTLIATEMPFVGRG